METDKISQDPIPGETMTYLPLLESHFTKQISQGTDVYGPRHTPMWMAVLDASTGRYPDFDHTPARVYRDIGAPRGVSLYWDQPLVVAACALSDLTLKPQYRAAAEQYIGSFLANCVGANGMFQWGNHLYYDAFEDKVVGFHNGYHELRPITPAWELFWRRDSRVCGNYIRAMLDRHVYDKASGAFNRHDDGRRGHAFIEAGGILVESAAWLYGKTRDSDLLDAAILIAGYSYGHRGAQTGLIVNQPDCDRWDARVSTTEVGLWAQSLIRAGEYAANNEFLRMAETGMRAYLEHGYDREAGMYFGQVNVKDGSPVVPLKKGYWPGKHSDVWNADQWPTHDYPMPAAEACIALHRKTGAPVFMDGVRRWAKIASAGPADGAGAYAENYGRCIHFLARAGRETGDETFIARARDLANEAVRRLYCDGMFQGYPGSRLYESVDGVGFLFLALIYLETGKDPDGLGFGF